MRTIVRFMLWRRLLTGPKISRDAVKCRSFHDHALEATGKTKEADKAFSPPKNNLARRTLIGSVLTLGHLAGHRS